MYKHLTDDSSYFSGVSDDTKKAFMNITSISVN